MSEPSTDLVDLSGVVRFRGHFVPPIGGGGGSVLVATRTVTSAEILAFNTPVELVPGVPGKIIWPIVVMLELVAGTTPYTDHGGFVDVAWGDPTAPVTDYQSVATAGFMDQPTSQFLAAAANIVGGPLPADPFAGVPLEIGSNGHALLTDGDGELVVTVFYVLIDVA